MRKVQTSILLEPDEFKRLNKIAEETGKSKSRLIRESLSSSGLLRAERVKTGDKKP